MSNFFKVIETEYEGELPFVRVRYEGVYNLAKTLDCGQCFRWERVSDDEWLGVAFERLISVKQVENELVIYNSTKEDFDNIWCYYFALDEDYEAIDRELLENCQNPTFVEALNEGRGIRILHQEAWETVCSFIISQSFVIAAPARAFGASPFVGNVRCGPFVARGDRYCHCG